MKSPIFNVFNPGPQVQTGNPLLNFLGNMPNGQNALGQTMKQYSKETNNMPLFRAIGGTAKDPPLVQDVGGPKRPLFFI